MSSTMNATAATMRTTTKLPMPIPRVKEQPAEKYEQYQEHDGSNHCFNSRMLLAISSNLTRARASSVFTELI